MASAPPARTNQQRRLAGWRRRWWCDDSATQTKKCLNAHDADAGSVGGRCRPERIGARGAGPPGSGKRGQRRGRAASRAASGMIPACLPLRATRRAPLLDAAAPLLPPLLLRSPTQKARTEERAALGPGTSARPAPVILRTWTAPGRPRGALDARACDCSVLTATGLEDGAAPARLLPLPTHTCRRHVRSPSCRLFVYSPDSVGAVWICVWWMASGVVAGGGGLT